MNEVFYLITNKTCLLGFNCNLKCKIDKFSTIHPICVGLKIKFSAYKQNFLQTYVFVLSSSMKSFCKPFQDIDIFHDAWIYTLYNEIMVPN